MNKNGKGVIQYREMEACHNCYGGTANKRKLYTRFHNGVFLGDPVVSSGGEVHDLYNHDIALLDNNRCVSIFSRTATSPHGRVNIANWDGTSTTASWSFVYAFDAPFIWYDSLIDFDGGGSKAVFIETESSHLTARFLGDGDNNFSASVIVAPPNMHEDMPFSVLDPVVTMNTQDQAMVIYHVSNGIGTMQWVSKYDGTQFLDSHEQIDHILSWWGRKAIALSDDGSKAIAAYYKPNSEQFDIVVNISE